MQQSVVYCIYKYFYCSSIKMSSIEFLLQQSVVYCISIAIHRNASSTRSRANALHCISPPAAAAPLLQLTDGKKNSPALFCPISDRNISDIWLQNVTSTRPLCVLDEHKYTPIRYSICSKIGSKQTQTLLLCFCLFSHFPKKLKHLSALAINI